MDAVVELRSVRRTFKTVVALADLSLQVPKGTITVLLGPNGAGKTTAARLITGALRAEAGAVRTFGVDPAGAHGSGRCPRWRGGVGPTAPFCPPTRGAEP